ncbi:MAG: GAF and HD-GYP domain-containing protein [Solirubrobacterales bacterium]
MTPISETPEPPRPRAGGVDSLSDLATRKSPSLETAVEAVREFLGFDVSYVTEMKNGEQHFRRLTGDGDSFGVGEGTIMPAEETYCAKVLDEKLPNLIPVIADEPEAAALSVTEAADVGAFVSVPLHFSDGEFFGTLCAASHERRPDIGGRDLQFLQVFARLISDQFERELAEERSRTLEVEGAAVEALVAAVDARDSYTAEHSRDVVDLASKVAVRMKLHGENLEDVKRVALLHDIGKIATPDSILQKPGPLSSEEWELMRRHPIESEKLILHSPGLARLAPMVRGEHERWDGNGYPDGLAGEQIPLASRITLTCDAYSAMITDRPYRKAMDEGSARKELAANAGTQFDPEVVDALLAVLDA